MASYTRQSSFADGDIIQASDFNDEFNQLVNAFANTSGHKHDGTAAEGPVIGLIGDPGVATPLNKVVVDDTITKLSLILMYLVPLRNSLLLKTVLLNQQQLMTLT